MRISDWSSDVCSSDLAAKVPVLVSPLTDLPSSFEQLGATQSNAGRLKAAGVDVSVGVFDDDDAHKMGYATQYAGNLVGLTRVPSASGLSWDQAFAAISSRSEEHTSELQSLMRISYAVFCLKKKKLI